MAVFKKIAVYGAGSFGSALAIQVAKRQENLLLFLSHETDIIEEINNNHTNSKYLGDIKFPDNIIATNDYKKLLEQDVIIIAIPSAYFSDTINLFKKLEIPSSTILLIATKGLCKNPTELISNRIRSTIPNEFAFIAGPNFAKEVAEGLPTSATIACENITLAKSLADNLESPNFTVTTTTDIITIQIASIIKNIMAIACGINEGQGYKENAKAALITKGLQEIVLMSRAFGGRLETITDPAVVGDLILTCYSKTSRNTKFGYEFAQAEDKKLFLDNYPFLVEGRESAKLILDLMKKHNIHLPVISSIAEILT